MISFPQERSRVKESVYMDRYVARCCVRRVMVSVRRWLELPRYNGSAGYTWIPVSLEFYIVTSDIQIAEQIWETVSTS